MQSDTRASVCIDTMISLGALEAFEWINGELPERSCGNDSFKCKYTSSPYFDSKFTLTILRPLCNTKLIVGRTFRLHRGLNTCQYVFAPVKSLLDSMESTGTAALYTSFGNAASLHGER